MSIRIILIAAVAENGVIGAKGDMPWRLPSDLQRFKQTTMGCPVVMGRKTFESIGRPLPGRPNIVVTRNREWQSDGAISTEALGIAIDLAKALATSLDCSDVFIIGGGEIYRQAMDIAEAMIITRVELEPEGDALFPEISLEEWELVSDVPCEASPKDNASTRLLTYERKQAP